MLFSSKIPAYLIDSENVGSTWVNLLQQDEKFELFICVTENAKSLNFSLLKELTGDHKHKINIIECEPGKNSLDFYLSSYLGYLIGRNSHSSYIIVSQDTGYDHVIEYWNKEGYKVTRINTKPEVTKTPRTRTSRKKTEKKPEAKKDSETRVITKKETAENKETVKKTVRKPRRSRKADPQTQLLKSLLKDSDDQEIKEVDALLKAIPVENRADKNHIYHELIRKYKAEKGLQIYSLIKKDIDKYYKLNEDKTA